MNHGFKLAETISKQSLATLLYAARATELAKLPRKQQKTSQVIVLKPRSC